MTDVNKITTGARRKKAVFIIIALMFVLQRLNIFKFVFSLIGLDSISTEISLVIFCTMDLIIAFFWIGSVIRTREYLDILFVAIFFAVSVIPFIYRRNIFQIEICIVFILSSIIGYMLLLRDEEGRKIFLSFFRSARIPVFICAVIYLAFTIVTGVISKDDMVIPVLSYGNIAQFFIPFYVIAMEDCFYNYKDNKEFIKLILFASVVVIAVMCSGLRTAIITLIFTVAILSLSIPFRPNKSLPKKKTIIPVVVIATIIVVFTYFPLPNSRLSLISHSGDMLYEDNYHHENAVNPNSTKNLTVFDVQKEEERLIDDVYFDYIVNSNDTKIATEEKLHEDAKSGEYKYIRPIDDEDIPVMMNYSLRLDRINLWKSTYLEFLKSPLFGNGMYYYETKYYKTMPHNIALEILCDYGIVGLAAVLIVFFYFAIKSTRNALKKGDSSFLSMMLLGIIYIPFFLLYTSLYNNEKWVYLFMIIIGYEYISKKNRRELKTDN